MGFLFPFLTFLCISLCLSFCLQGPLIFHKLCLFVVTELKREFFGRQICLHWESLIHRSLNSFSLSFLSLVKNCNHKGLGIYYLWNFFEESISISVPTVIRKTKII